jgi:hypothetical protein
MLAGLAAAVTRGAKGWLGAFILAFGVWDLAFYLWLRVLTGWPASLLTWDLLFLLPVPWAAPVLAPVIVATTMSIYGARMLLRPAQPLSGLGNVARLGNITLVAGSAVLFASFIWDWRRWMDGAIPSHFPWAIFALGEALIIAGFLGYFRPASVSGNNIGTAASKLE